MAFIRRKKNTGGRTSYHVVESRREGCKVRQVVLCTLMYSPTIGEALAVLDRYIAETARTYEMHGNPEVGARHKRWVAQRQKLLDVQQRTGLP